MTRRAPPSRRKPSRARPRNPQAEQMADESMVRTLAAQAEAIWPQEREILLRHGIPDGASILDVGCGTGEIAARLAEMFPRARILGVDLLEPSLARARERCRAFGPRVEFRRGDAFRLDLPDRSRDLVLCRHLVQAVPDVPRLVRELARVGKPGGVVHVIAEDYGMMHFHPTRKDSDRFWREGPMTFARKLGTDLRIGRRMFSVLADAGLRDVAVDYVTVDTLRVPRETFARIWEAWRDGYADAIARESGMPLAEVRAHWDDMIACLRDPRGYGVWQVPVWSARVP